MKTFRDLLVWQKSMKLVTEIYGSTRAFPREELFGLVSQMRRAAVSVPSNIAEGYGRRSTNEYLRFLQVAMGSLFELQTQLEIAFHLAYLNNTDFTALYEATRELERMLSSLIRSVREGAKGHRH